MMGRDDIPVGLGSFTALGTPFLSCKYVNAIPHGSGGLIDSDTLFGLAHNLPQSPRRYRHFVSATKFSFHALACNFPKCHYLDSGTLLKMIDNHLPWKFGR